MPSAAPAASSRPLRSARCSPYLARRRGLAWTWSLFSLLPPLAILARVDRRRPGALARAALEALALALGLAFGAVLLSAHSRQDDRRAGADREAAAKRRRGVVRRPAPPPAASGWRAGASVLESEVPLGRDERGALVCIPRGSARSGAHVLIPGATGAGKTTSLAALLADYVANAGFGAVVLGGEVRRSAARGRGAGGGPAAASPSASSRPRGPAAMTRSRAAASTSAPSA